MNVFQSAVAFWSHREQNVLQTKQRYQDESCTHRLPTVHTRRRSLTPTNNLTVTTATLLTSQRTDKSRALAQHFVTVLCQCRHQQQQYVYTLFIISRIIIPFSHPPLHLPLYLTLPSNLSLPALAPPRLVYLFNARESGDWGDMRMGCLVDSHVTLMFSLSLTEDDVGCDLPVTEPLLFHGLTTVSATEASLLLDPELRHDISFGLFRRELKSHLFV